jgi:hypothetical protein
MAMGQAAGVAATLAARDSVAPYELDTNRLQTKLIQQGQIFGNMSEG